MIQKIDVTVWGETYEVTAKVENGVLVSGWIPGKVKSREFMGTAASQEAAFQLGAKWINRRGEAVVVSRSIA